MRLSLDALTTNARYSFLSYYHKNFPFLDPARQSVYIVPQHWTKTAKPARASILFQKSGPSIFVSSNDFIHYPPIPDFTVFTKIGHPKKYTKSKSVYIVPQHWTKFYRTRQSV